MIIPYHINLVLSGLDQGHYLAVSILAEHLAVHTGDAAFIRAAAVCAQLARLVEDCVEEELYHDWDPPGAFSKKSVEQAFAVLSSCLSRPKPEWHLEDYKGEEGQPYDEVREDLLAAIPTLEEAAARLDTVWYGPWRTLWLGGEAPHDHARPPLSVLPGSTDKPVEGNWIEVRDGRPAALSYLVKGQVIECLEFGENPVLTRCLAAQARTAARGEDSAAAALYDVVRGEIERLAKKTEDRGECVCSFCSRPQSEVRKLIAGPTCYICNECIDLCNDIMADEVSEGSVEEASGENSEKDGQDGEEQ